MAYAKKALVLTKGIQLNLSYEEAQTLADVLAAIAGDPKKSRRKFIESISSALEEVGVSWGNSNCRDIRNFIEFVDFK